MRPLYHCFPIPWPQATLGGDGYATGGGYTTAGLTSGTEAMASDMEGGAAKKEKKKKKTKTKELLHYREKSQPEKLKSMSNCKNVCMCVCVYVCMYVLYIELSNLDSL